MPNFSTVRVKKLSRANQLEITATLILGASVTLTFNSARSQNVFIEPGMTVATSSTNANQGKYSIRAASDLVLIPVTVVDQQGNYVIGLERDHFRLYDDNEEQTITHFSMDDAPASVGFVFDTSGSMVGKERKSRDAVTSFLKAANPEDEFFLVQFSSYVKLVMGITRDTQELQRRLMLAQPEGSTSLLDAVYFSIREMRNAHNARKALIIVSDGGDNYSRYTLKEIQNAMIEADLQIYAIGLFEPIHVRSRSKEERSGPDLLNRISRETAGRFFEVANIQQLPDVASKIGLALRNQYVLAYKPSEAKHDGRYHHIQVTLAPPEHFSRLQAFWKQSYYAPKD
jgi:Ca-activated chloride channel family protein